MSYNLKEIRSSIREDNCGKKLDLDDMRDQISQTCSGYNIDSSDSEKDSN